MIDIHLKLAGWAMRRRYRGWDVRASGIGVERVEVPWLGEEDLRGRAGERQVCRDQKRKTNTVGDILGLYCGFVGGEGWKHMGGKWPVEVEVAGLLR